MEHSQLVLECHMTTKATGIDQNNHMDVNKTTDVYHV